jgi:hypothetical protein
MVTSNNAKQTSNVSWRRDLLADRAIAIVSERGATAAQKWGEIGNQKAATDRDYRETTDSLSVTTPELKISLSHALREASLFITGCSFSE